MFYRFNTQQFLAINFRLFVISSRHNSAAIKKRTGTPGLCFSTQAHNETGKATTYQALCAEYYNLDKPQAPKDALQFYLKQAKKANGRVLEPMCGTGRFLIPLLKAGIDISGFDASSHMLDICKKKMKDAGGSPEERISQATFNTFVPDGPYKLIFIPSGSFGLLIEHDVIQQALEFISKHLDQRGRFIFEFETPNSVNQNQGMWSGNWVSRKNGEKIIISTLSRFDPSTKIDNTICRYELWENNAITKTEIEDFRVRLYEPQEVEEMLQRHGLVVSDKVSPYTNCKSLEGATNVIYECKKNSAQTNRRLII